MTGIVHLTEVVLLRKSSIPNLNEQRLAEIEELVSVEIGQSIGLIGVEIFSWDPVC